MTLSSGKGTILDFRSVKFAAHQNQIHVKYFSDMRCSLSRLPVALSLLPYSNNVILEQGYGMESQSPAAYIS
jgi:hypothetical protein